MAIDIVPELLEKIQKSFDTDIRKNEQLQRIQKMIANGTATYEQAYQYAQVVGETLAQAFEMHISSETLPDGHMYYNIANRILNPTLNRNYTIVASVAVEIREILNLSAGLGMRGIRPHLN